MIANKNINPTRDVYILGASVIEILSKKQTSNFEIIELFNEVKKKEKVSLQLFAFVLDWLFILGAIKRTSQGTLEKCF